MARKSKPVKKAARLTRAQIVSASKQGAAKAAKSAVRKRPEEHSENCLHMHCQKWLVDSGIFYQLLIFHVPNERKGGIGAIMKFKRLGVLPGVADYLVFRSADRKFALELKDEDGEQSEDQEKFQRRWEASGGQYFIVRTVEQFQGIIDAIFLF